jgi:hypothetical protein
MGHANSVIRGSAAQYSSGSTTGNPNIANPATPSNVSQDYLDRLARVQRTKQASAAMPATARQEFDCIGNDEDELQQCPTTRAYYPITTRVPPAVDFVSLNRSQQGVTTIPQVIT